MAKRFSPPTGFWLLTSRRFDLIWNKRLNNGSRDILPSWQKQPNLKKKRFLCLMRTPLCSAKSRFRFCLTGQRPLATLTAAEITRIVFADQSRLEEPRLWPGQHLKTLQHDVDNNNRWRRAYRRKSKPSTRLFCHVQIYLLIIILQ